MIVDHAHPFHDGFCRCPECKPSPVGDQASRLFRVKLALALSSIMGVALVIADIVR